MATQTQVTERSNAKDAIQAQANKRKRKTGASPRDPDANHPALRGLGDLPGIRKDAKGNVLEQTPQADPKTVNLADLVLNKKDMEVAQSVADKFRKEGGAYVSMKEKLEAAKGGLSNIMMEIAKRAAERASDNPQWRLAWFLRLCAYAESKAIADYKKQHGVNTEPKVKDAINPSWQTYKSQISRSINGGYNPAQFANGTAFRKAAAPAPRRAPRTPEGGEEGALAAEGLAKADPMIGGVMAKLMERLAKVPEEKRDEAAEILSTAMHDVEGLIPKAQRKRKGVPSTTEATEGASEETHAAM